MIYFDLSSSVTYIGRNPVGIVRVEMKLAQYALDHLSPEEVTFCYFDLTRKKVLSLTFPKAREVLNHIGHGQTTQLILADPDDPPAEEPEQAPEPEQKSSGIMGFLLRKFKRRQPPPHPTATKPVPRRTGLNCEPLDVPWTEKDTFVTVGLIWDIWPTDRLYAAKKLQKFRVAFMIYDLIPFKVPGFCRGVPPAFFQIVADLLWCSEKVITISDCTTRDLHNYIAEFDLPKPDIKTNIMGMNIASLPENFTPPHHELDTTRLMSGRFILQVGTMEPRKNHQLICNAYRYLIREGHRDQLIPWVIVGAQAWGLNDLVESIQLDPELFPGLVVLSNHVSDETLAWLYHNCAFTVYPSHYEGWGLPVSESLAFGKFCLTGTNAALREAADGFAESIEPFDTIAWANRLLELMTHPELVQKKNEEIRNRYHIRTWEESGRDFFQAIR